MKIGIKTLKRESKEIETELLKLNKNLNKKY